MWLPIEAWLWGLAIISSILISAGSSVIGLISPANEISSADDGISTTDAAINSTDKRRRAFMMLPLYLQPTSPPSLMSGTFTAFYAAAIITFFGSLIALAIISSTVLTMIGGFIMFISMFQCQNWWIRNMNCRPMKPVLLWSVALLLTAMAATIDILRG